MATATLKRTRAGNVSKTALDQVGSLLQDLPEKTKDQLSLRDAVAQLQDIIKATLAKGYSYEDVAALLAEQTIVISPTTLKRYVLTNSSRTTQKRTPAKGKTKRSPQASSAEGTEQPEAIATEPDTETPPAAKATRGRRKSSVAEQPEGVEKPRRGRTSQASAQRSSATRGRKTKA
ncbi:MAG: hypothetical protein HY785_28785 [Oscillatoriophycideae cyanobacterium NC_groundwater_1537_Pr4_S-0.65um_50_18]|nr:hypothetical protein [Oscillatoriophycideae cyanobacterium NC_groundwater_1537_Pr4_S-0.65um_50_18]